MPKVPTELKRIYQKRYENKDPERARALGRARANRYAERNREKIREIGNGERMKKLRAEWRKRNPEKASAQWAVSHALRAGKLIKQPCWCGDPKSQAHHPDYSKKLEVVWLCQKHHKELHRIEATEGGKLAPAAS